MNFCALLVRTYIPFSMNIPESDSSLFEEFGFDRGAKVVVDGKVIFLDTECTCVRRHKRPVRQLDQLAAALAGQGDHFCPADTGRHCGSTHVFGIARCADSQENVPTLRIPQYLLCKDQAGLYIIRKSGV